MGIWHGRNCVFLCGYHQLMNCLGCRPLILMRLIRFWFHWLLKLPWLLELWFCPPWILLPLWVHLLLLLYRSFSAWWSIWWCIPVRAILVAFKILFWNYFFMTLEIWNTNKAQLRIYEPLTINWVSWEIYNQYIRDLFRSIETFLLSYCKYSIWSSYCQPCRILPSKYYKSGLKVYTDLFIPAVASPYKSTCHYCNRHYLISTQYK